LTCDLDIKAKVNDITIFNDIIFAFKSPFTRFFSAGFAFIANIIVKADDFGSNKSFFKVGMDFSGSLWRAGADGNGPGGDGTNPEQLFAAGYSARNRKSRNR
jgi:hypothetical protein